MSIHFISFHFQKSIRYPNTTNLHFHGLHISPETEDNIFRMCEPQQSILYDLQIPIDHPTGLNPKFLFFSFVAFFFFFFSFNPLCFIFANLSRNLLVSPSSSRFRRTSNRMWYEKWLQTNIKSQSSSFIVIKQIGMAGALIIEDDISETPQEIRNMRDVTLVLQHFLFENVVFSGINFGLGNLFAVSRRFGTDYFPYDLSIKNVRFDSVVWFGEFVFEIWNSCFWSIGKFNLQTEFNDSERTIPTYDWNETKRTTKMEVYKCWCFSFRWMWTKWKKKNTKTMFVYFLKLCF